MSSRHRDEGLQTVLLAALAFLILMLAVGLIDLAVHGPG